MTKCGRQSVLLQLIGLPKKIKAGCVATAPWKGAFYPGADDQYDMEALTDWHKQHIKSWESATVRQVSAATLLLTANRLARMKEVGCPSAVRHFSYVAA